MLERCTTTSEVSYMQPPLLLALEVTQKSCTAAKFLGLKSLLFSMIKQVSSSITKIIT